MGGVVDVFCFFYFFATCWGVAVGEDAIVAEDVIACYGDWIYAWIVETYGTRRLLGCWRQAGGDELFEGRHVVDVYLDG